MEEGGEACNTGLSLGLIQNQQQIKPKQPKPPVLFHVLFPPNLKEEEEVIDNDDDDEDADGSSSRTIDETQVDLKKNEDTISCNGKNNTRKKLRLTKDQSTLLEDSFNEHPTLNTIQKLELAKQLKLRPRQVEVWFQNRRARNKLKQTEVDCEFLKKCCESLRDENRRLKKELQELRSMKNGGSTSPFYIQLPKGPTLTICPSCERVARTGDGKNGMEVVEEMARKGSRNKLFTGMDDATMAC